jgi:drug/metabolite transporter (DMT)-like permease
MARPQPQTPARPRLVWIALAAIYVIWSTTYLAIRVVNETLPPLLATAIRFLVAGSVLYAIAIRTGDRVGDRPGPRQWRSAAIVGMLLMFCGNGGVVWAERTIPSGLAALVIATVPLWMVVFDRLVYHHRQPRAVLVGLVLGFAGAALLVAGSITGHVAVGGVLLVVAAAICWAAGSLYQRTAPVPRRPLVGAAMQMLIAGSAFLLVGVVSGELHGLDRSAFSRASLLALAYLIVFGSWIGFTSYLWLLRHARTSLVSTYAYVTPVGAVLLGTIFLDETLSLRTVIAGALIVVAVAIIITAGGRARGAEGSDAGQERGPEVQPQGGLDRVGSAEQRGLPQDGRGELQADGEPA